MVEKQRKTAKRSLGFTKRPACIHGINGTDCFVVPPRNDKELTFLSVIARNEVTWQSALTLDSPSLTSFKLLYFLIHNKERPQSGLFGQGRLDWKGTHCRPQQRNRMNCFCFRYLLDLYLASAAFGHYCSTRMSRNCLKQLLPDSQR